MSKATEAMDEVLAEMEQPTAEGFGIDMDEVPMPASKAELEVILTELAQAIMTQTLKESAASFETETKIMVRTVLSKAADGCDDVAAKAETTATELGARRCAALIRKMSTLMDGD